MTAAASSPCVFSFLVDVSLLDAVAGHAVWHDPRVGDGVGFRRARGGPGAVACARVR